MTDTKTVKVGTPAEELAARIAKLDAIIVEQDAELTAHRRLYRSANGYVVALDEMRRDPEAKQANELSTLERWFRQDLANVKKFRKDKA